MKITFYRSALNSDGIPYKLSLMSVSYSDVAIETQAIEDAKKEFQERMKVEHWQDIAECYEIT